MRHKIVLMIGGTETLEYFSLQLKKGFELLGYKTFLFNQEMEEESAEALYKFADSYDTILVTFNFDGIHYETSLFDVQGISIWDKRKIPCVNIVADHPFYYPELLEIISRMCDVTNTLSDIVKKQQEIIEQSKIEEAVKADLRQQVKETDRELDVIEYHSRRFCDTDNIEATFGKE